MNEVRSLSQQAPSSDEVLTVSDLILAVWRKKVYVLIGAVVGGGLATAYALFVAQAVFVSSALLLPTQASNSSDQLSAAASLLGKKSSSNADVELYQSLLTSRTVIHKLIRAQIVSGFDSTKGQILPLFKVLGGDTSSLKQVDALTASLTSAVSVSSRESGEGGILEVNFEAQTPWLAQQIGNQLLSQGLEELQNVRVERSDIVLDRLSIAVEKARSEWDSIARSCAIYRDRNRSIFLPDQVLAVSRLEMEKSAKEQKYLLARKELEVLKLDRMKAVPPMMVLDSFNLPSTKAKPKRMLIVILGVAAGVLSSSFVVAFVAAFFSGSRELNAESNYEPRAPQQAVL